MLAIRVDCRLFLFFSFLPTVLGVPGASKVFAPGLLVLIATLYAGMTISDHVAPPEVKAMKAAEDALSARQRDASDKERAEKSEKMDRQVLMERAEKLKSDLEWEEVKRDYASPGGKERLAEKREAEWMAKQAQLPDPMPADRQRADQLRNTLSYGADESLSAEKP